MNISVPKQVPTEILRAGREGAEIPFGFFAISIGRVAVAAISIFCVFVVSWLRFGTYNAPTNSDMYDCVQRTTALPIFN